MTHQDASVTDKNLQQCERFWSETLGAITDRFPAVRQWLESNPEEIVKLEAKFKYKL